MAKCSENCVHWHLCNTYGINTHCHDKDNVEELCRDFYDPDRCGVKHVYWISCSTGCTCCADQNFDYGFYLNREDAEAQAEAWRNGIHNPLASQYAKYGRYHVEEDDAEVLPDGRWIVAGTVFDTDEIEYLGTLYW